MKAEKAKTKSIGKAFTLKAQNKVYVCVIRDENNVTYHPILLCIYIYIHFLKIYLLI